MNLFIINFYRSLNMTKRKLSLKEKNFIAKKIIVDIKDS